MSHTVDFGKTRFVSNSDLSGDVEIIKIKSGKRVTVPGDDLIAFVAEHIRDLKIKELEDMDAIAVLKKARK